MQLARVFEPDLVLRLRPNLDASLLASYVRNFVNVIRYMAKTHFPLAPYGIIDFLGCVFVTIPRRVEDCRYHGHRSSEILDI